MLSLWEATAEMPEFPKLKGNIKTDVLIIGGGIAGILCGYKLKMRVSAALSPKEELSAEE